MKKIITISLSFFVVFLIFVFAMWFGSMQNQQKIKEQPEVVLNMQEVAKHNIASDCWVVVRGRVYNLTSFSSLHTGGSDKILYNCGKDGTNSFDTKGGKGSHKETSLDVLNNYLLGDLVN